MYRIINTANGRIIGSSSEVSYIRRKPETGALVPTDVAHAEGVAYRSEAYNLSGTVGIGAEITVVIGEYDAAEELDAIMATVVPDESGPTASQSYTKGKYFYHNGDFCKAKTAIPSGATFTLNTNYETTTVAAELFRALNSL